MHSAQNSYSYYLYATHKLSARGHRLSLRHQLFYARGNSASNDLTEYRYFIAQDNRPDPLVNRRYDSRWHNFNQQTFVDLFVPAGRFFTARATYGNVTVDNLNLQSGYRLDTLGGHFADYDDYLAHFGLLPARPRPRSTSTTTRSSTGPRPTSSSTTGAASTPTSRAPCA